MATNNIKPFATGKDANILTDVELASRSELQTGFVPKSKADSALIGKLIQNATAGSAALGDYIATKTQQDVSASDTNLATKLESAITAHIQAEAPRQDLSGYATKSEVTQGLAGKLDTTGKAQTAGTADIANTLASTARIPYSQITNTPSIPDISWLIPKVGNRGITAGNELWGYLSGTSTTVSFDSPDNMLISPGAGDTFLTFTFDNTISSNVGKVATKLIWISGSSLSATPTVAFNYVGGGSWGWFAKTIPTLKKNNVFVCVLHDAYVDIQLIGAWD